MSKVLIIEDDGIAILSICTNLENKDIEVLLARTLLEAANLFSANQDVDIIVMDACLGSKLPNTITLTETIVASGFEGHIIASSSKPLFSEDLVKAGATHVVEKNSVVKKILELL